MRSLKKMQKSNDGTRSLFESVMSDEVIKTLGNWSKAIEFLGLSNRMILIGGLAVSYYLKPRMTQDIDFLFPSDASIPVFVEGFKKTRKHAFQDNSTHVEIEIVTPEYVNYPQETSQYIFATARKKSNGIWIASPSGLVASKLFRLSLQDKADIAGLINFEKIDLQGFQLSVDKIEKFNSLLIDAERESKIKDISLDDELDHIPE